MPHSFLLDDLCIQITDGTHSTVKNVEGGDCYLLSAKNIKDKVVISNNERKIDTITLNNLRKRTKTEKNDILVTSVGTIGEMAIVDDENPNYEFQRSVAIIKPDSTKVVPIYLYYYLRNMKQKLNSMSTGAVQKCLFIGQIKGIEITLPNLETQKKIAEILSSLDEKIELNRKMNETLEQMGQALFRHYFTDNPEAKKWSIGVVGDILSELQSGARSKGGAVKCGIPSIGAENIIGLGKYNFLKEKYISDDFFDKLNRGIIQSEDVLLYKDGAYVGKKSLFMDNFPHSKAAINEHVFMLRHNDNLPSQFYLYFWLDQEKITKMIIDAGVKAAQPGINKNNVNSLPILIPPIDTLREFDNKIRPFMAEIFNNANESKTLIALRDTLLPRLINGKLKLNQ